MNIETKLVAAARAETRETKWKPFLVFDFSDESEPPKGTLVRLDEIIKESTKEIRGLTYSNEYHKDRKAYLHIWRAEAVYK